MTNQEKNKNEKRIEVLVEAIVDGGVYSWIYENIKQMSIEEFNKLYDLYLEDYEPGDTN